MAAVRRTLRVRRAGHAGTLDPFATGLLVVLVGRATRLQRYLVGLPKRYEGTIRLGRTTDSGDPTGRVTAETVDAHDLPDDAVRPAMAALTGRYRQTPPAFSAKQRGGERAYVRARRGEAVALDPVEVEVRRFDLTGRDGATLAFAAEVSSGTYLRALARDLGERLGSGAHLTALRRTAVGSFTIAEAAPLPTIGQGTAPLRPLREAVAHLPQLGLDADARGRVIHGRPVPAPPELRGRGPVALVADGELLAVAEPQDGVLAPRVVLAG